MPTSLVSTGVQFPDSTIQTTAASPAGLVLISSVTPTAATTVSFNFSGSYDNYYISISGVKPNTTQTFKSRVSIGGTLQTSSIYNTLEGVPVINASTAAASRNEIPTQMGSQYGVNSGLPAEYAMSANIFILGVNSGQSKYFDADVSMYYSGGSGDAWYASKSNASIQTTSALSGITFYWGSGSINFAAQGKIKLYGYSN